MATVKVIDPLSRLEGHLKIEVTIDTVDGVQQVVDAHATGTMFRGFEILLNGRPPADAPHITQRICGVCPISHAVAACKAVEGLGGITIPENARLMRNLILGANHLDSNILHFYHLSALDFVDGPAQTPWQPSWSSDKRITGADAQTLINHYIQALDMRRKAQEMGALFSGRLPHPSSIIPGGVTTTPRTDRIAKYRQYLTEIAAFIDNVWVADINLVAQYYPDYYDLGAGPRNLLAFGVFDLNASGSSKLFRMGRAMNGSASTLPVDTNQIMEQVGHSWFRADSAGAPATGSTTPLYPKADAYSWLKAPRYQAQPYEVGPLARVWVNGDYRRGISVLDRHVARLVESQKIAAAMPGWLDALQPNASVVTPYTPPSSASAFGLTEAPRGALGHWLSVSNRNIARYQIVTPTCWNASPRDDQGGLGPIEQALLHIPVLNADQPNEVLRVVHSFDPCLACAVHVMHPGKEARVLNMGMSCV
jgi:hydrogenase large subunit